LGAAAHTGLAELRDVLLDRAWYCGRPPGCCFDRRAKLWVAGLLVFLSAVFDCADGQLARMRKSSSPFGRMLDGIADLVVSIAVVGRLGLDHLGQIFPAALARVGRLTTDWDRHRDELVPHDRLRALQKRIRPPHSPDLQRRRRSRDRPGRYHADLARYSTVERVVWRLYLYFSQRQFAFLERFDPFTDLAYSKYPARSELHRSDLQAGGRSPDAHVAQLVWVWLAGVRPGLVHRPGRPGSITCCSDSSCSMHCFYGYMRPAQRAASRRAFTELRQLQAEAA